jgi:L-ribulose-5-phosphate 3-epimerase UlaE
MLDALPELGYISTSAMPTFHRRAKVAHGGAAFPLSDRLLHVHLSDNKGKSDDHLAIGAGTIDWKKELRLLKASGYDDTITLEIFTGTAI